MKSAALIAVVVYALGAVLPGWTADAALSATAPEDWPSVQQLIGPVAVLPIAPRVYMLTIDGLNIGVQIGPQGVVVVNAGPAEHTDAVLAAIRQLSSEPIRYLISTSGDRELIGGNQAIAAAGRSLMQNPLSRPAGNVVDAYVGRYAVIVARASLLDRLVAEQRADLPTWALPSEVFERPTYDFFINDEPVSVIWTPAAHTRDDTVVRFQRSDVVVAGAIFDATAFPVIDLAHGGSIQGELDALNTLLNRLSFAPSGPIVSNTGGTVIIPLRGPLSDQGDVLTYRDMVAAMRDRVQDLMAGGMTLKQVLAADPAQGFKARYGSAPYGYGADQFVEAIYGSLRQERAVRKKK